MDYPEKLKVFNEIYEKAIKNVYDGWCYVQDASISNYTNTDVDVSLVERFLERYNGAADAWRTFLDRGIYPAMYELHIRTAIAVAVAIRVFVCPEAEIVFGCETSKYSEGEVDYWWAISSIAPNGFALDSEAKYDNYLSSLKKGEVFVTENNKGFVITGGVLEMYTGSDTSIVIPSTVKVIGWGVFAESKITSIDIPDSVTKIEDRAFYRCKELVSVKLSSKLKKISEEAFTWCENLESIKLPEALTEIERDAFKGCKKLKTIVVNNNLNKVGEYVFGSFNSACENLSCIVPGPGISSYSDSPLQIIFERHHTDLFNGKQGVREARILAFWLGNCFELVKDDEKALKKIRSYKKYIVDVCVCDDNASALINLLSLFNPLKIREITDLIDLAHNKKSTAVADSLRVYGEGLYTKEKMEKKKSPKDGGSKKMTLADYKKIFSFKTEGDTATITGYKGTNLEVVIPEKFGKYSIVSIDEWAFSPSSTYATENETRENIKSVFISNGVKEIGPRVFDSCRSLTSITIPDSVTTIGAGAYAGCTALESIAIPDGVTSIASSAFEGCANLTSITIPKSVTSIDSDAFRGCTNLTSITIPDSVTNVGVHAFDNTGYINDGKNWGNDVLYIGNHLIKANIAILGNHAIKEGTKTIAGSAFSNCTNLASITIPKSVTRIGWYAFEGCRNLSSITIPDSVTSIGFSAFEGCTNLTSITIPDSVTSIGSDTFKNCTNLISITIPSSVTSIVRAFWGCFNLTIHAPAGSYAEQYAKENNIKFIAE